MITNNFYKTFFYEFPWTIYFAQKMKSKNYNRLREAHIYFDEIQTQDFWYHNV